MAPVPSMVPRIHFAAVQVPQFNGSKSTAVLVNEEALNALTLNKAMSFLTKLL